MFPVQECRTCKKTLYYYPATWDSPAESDIHCDKKGNFACDDCADLDYCEFCDEIIGRDVDHSDCAVELEALAIGLK